MNKPLHQVSFARKEYLVAGLVISICLHAVFFFIRFAGVPKQLNNPPTLDVAIINMENDVAPIHAQVLAQSNLLGGGNSSGLSTTPLPVTSNVSSKEIVLAELRERQKQLEHEQQQLLTAIEAQLKVEPHNQTPDPIANSPEQGEDYYEQQNLILSAQIAALKDQIQRYNEMPRQYFTGPSAKKDIYARYLEAWRTHIEQLGTEHYPEQAKGRIYGSLQLTVYINKDGSLENVEIDRPSEHPILNQAALRIVQMAAPFAPLPQAIRDETDVLAVTRTWLFQNKQLETSIP